MMHRELGLTRELARFEVEPRWSSIPMAINHEAKRALLNWAGCALGGCPGRTVDTALVASEFAGPRQARYSLPITAEGYGARYKRHQGRHDAQGQRRGGLYSNDWR
jgi:hypothetical protein